MAGKLRREVRDLEAAYEQISQAVEQKDAGKATRAFTQFGQAVDAVDGSLDELSAGEISAEVPVADLEVGDNEVMPIVRTPRGTEAVRVTPETVRVTVAEAP